MDQWILLQHGIFVYIVLFLLLMGGAIGLPIPEDIPLILAGVVAQMGRADLICLGLVCYASIILGDVIIFAIGRKFGPALFQKKWFKTSFRDSKVRKLRLNLERRSIPMIFIARHLFYLRTATFLTCGAVRMRFSRFLFADALAALISVPLMLTLGYLGAAHYDTVLMYIKKAKYFSIILGVLLLGVAIIYFTHLKRKAALETEAIDFEDLKSDDSQGPL